MAITEPSSNTNALTTVGETDRALDLLEQSVKPGGYVRVSPNRVWDPLRENPRFKRLQQVETAGTGG